MQFRRCQYSSGRNIIKYLQWYNVGVWIIQYGFLYDLIRSQDERLRKLSVVQHRLKIIMITVNFLCALSPRVGNRGTEKNLVNIVSIVEKSGGKRLGRCSATLMVGYLCCKSYYMCALSICIFAFYVHPHIQYERAAVRCDTLHCCRVFFAVRYFTSAFIECHSTVLLNFPLHNQSFGFNAAGIKMPILILTYDRKNSAISVLLTMNLSEEQRWRWWHSGAIDQYRILHFIL